VLGILYDAVSKNKTWDEDFYLQANEGRQECAPLPPLDGLMHFWARGGFAAGCSYRFFS
jgi:hypothetical protein